MLVQVEYDTGGRPYTFACPDGAAVGVNVEVPSALFGGTQLGTIVALGSDYTGPVRSVVRVIPAGACVDCGSTVNVSESGCCERCV